MKSRSLKLVLVVLAFGLVLIDLGSNEAAAEGVPGPGVCDMEDYQYCFEGCREVYGFPWVGTCDDSTFDDFKFCRCWKVGG